MLVIESRCELICFSDKYNSGRRYIAKNFEIFEVFTIRSPVKSHFDSNDNFSVTLNFQNLALLKGDINGWN